MITFTYEEFFWFIVFAMGLFGCIGIFACVKRRSLTALLYIVIFESWFGLALAGVHCAIRGKVVFAIILSGMFILIAIILFAWLVRKRRESLDTWDS